MPCRDDGRDQQREVRDWVAEALGACLGWGRKRKKKRKRNGGSSSRVEGGSNTKKDASPKKAGTRAGFFMCY